MLVGEGRLAQHRIPVSGGGGSCSCQVREGAVVDGLWASGKQRITSVPKVTQTSSHPACD